ncbi:NAD(P)/FAD-dependent oxidoreductase [Bacillus infantis]|uniref:NAD(P)/FAD-dependent oxidoreductase n=1 Tax=Bacillus infantis TaxID=324767 RepID=UPI003CF981B8
MTYDCIIIGGGIAGLQAAIQLGRYKHKVLVIDSNHGRSTICKSYHNIMGYPDGVSGQELRDIGRSHAERLGVEFKLGKAEKAESKGSGFEITLEDGGRLESERLLLSTGVMDRIPEFPNLYPTLGVSVYVCPDCDGYEVKDKRTIVIGSGNPGANMAVTLSYWTDELVFINHEKKEVSQELMGKLRDLNIEYMEEPIAEAIADGPNIQGFLLENGQKVMGERGFTAFGGNAVKSDLAKQLGVERLENKHINVDPRSKMTNVKNVWAAGDVVAHSEQVTIAMGDGSQAAIWIHKSILAEENK